MDDVSIVIVDDDTFTRKYLEKALAHMDNNISSFADAFSAWMYIKNNCTDLVICDVHMDGMNGFDLLKSIKQLFPETKCIMISADHFSRAYAKELGADAFFSKPFKLLELMQTISFFCEDANTR